MADKTTAKILKQVDFYFSDSNLPKDKFLKGLVDKDPEGWVEIAVISSFARMKSLSTDQAVIVAAIKESTLLQVSEDGTKLKRNAPLPEKTNFLDNTIYAKGFAAETTLDTIEEFFTSHLEDGEKITCVRMRRMKDKTFKGSVFVEFNSKATADRVAGLTLKFTGQDEPLAIMTKGAYIAKKKAELAASGSSKKRKADEEPKEEKEYAKGLIVYMAGLTEEASRESIKECFEGIECKVGFVEYSRGQVEGYIRLDESSAVTGTDAAAKLTEAKTEISGAAVTFKVLEGEEEKSYWTKVREQKNQKFKGKGGYKGKKNFNKKPRN